MQGGLVFSILGRALVAMAFAMIPSLIFARIDKEDVVFDAFLTSIATVLFIGGLLLLAFRKAERTEKLNIVLPSMMVVAVILGLFAGFPTALLGEGPFWIMAFFDGMSMVSTTGILSLDMDPIPRAVVMWQANMGLIGGFLAVVIALSIFHYANSGGLQLHNSPMPHGTSEGLYNRFLHAIRTLFPLYIGAQFVGFLLLNLGPMDGFEAWVRSASGISTHGFNMTDGSNEITGLWSQFILLMLMLFGALNLDYHYGWLKGRWRVYTQDSESVSFLKFVALAISVFWVLAIIELGRGAFNLGLLWDGLFVMTSMLSTTGLAVPDVQLIDFPGVGVLLISLVVLGGCVISGAGGVKIMRFLIILRHLWSELVRIAQPHGIATVRYARRIVSQRDLEAVWLLGSGFLLLIVAGTISLAVLGVPFDEALPMAVSATTTTGPLVDYISPNFPGYVGLMDGEYLILAVLMLFGRIEVSLLLGLLVKSLWQR